MSVVEGIPLTGTAAAVDPVPVPCLPVGHFGRLLQGGDQRRRRGRGRVIRNTASGGRLYEQVGGRRMMCRWGFPASEQDYGGGGLVDLKLVGEFHG